MPRIPRHTASVLLLVAAFLIPLVVLSLLDGCEASGDDQLAAIEAEELAVLVEIARSREATKAESGSIDRVLDGLLLAGIVVALVVSRDRWACLVLVICTTLLCSCTAATMESASGGRTTLMALGGKGGFSSQPGELTVVSWDNEKSMQDFLTAAATSYASYILGAVEKAKVAAESAVTTEGIRAGTEKARIAAGTDQAKIKAGVDSEKIKSGSEAARLNAQTDQARIAAEGANR